LIGLPLILSAAALLTLIGFFTAPAMASTGDGLGAGQTITVTVGSGQTLWEVASDVAPERNPHDVIAEISQLNNLSGSIVQAGQQLHVPVNGSGPRP
jgi:LysM repeat protein